MSTPDTPPLHFKEDNKHPKTSTWSLFLRGKPATGKETALASTADSMLSKLWSRTWKRLTAGLHKDKVGKSFVIPASQECLSYTGPKG